MNEGIALALAPGWKRRRLRFDVRTNPVKSELELPDDTEVSFVPMDAVGELGGLRLDQTREVADVYNGYTYFADGDVCIAKITPCFENGKGAIAEGLTSGVAFGTTELHVLRPSPTLDTRFLFYLTIAHDFRCFGESEMLGAGGQKRVPEEFLKDWMPPLPRIDVQQRIARFLDEKTARIDSLIEKKQALLERLAEKRRTLITRAVTGGFETGHHGAECSNTWSGVAPTEWNVKRLRHIFQSCKNGAWGSEPEDNNSVPCIRAADFDGQSGFLKDGERTLRALDEATLAKVGLRQGDLVIEKSGGGDKQLVGRAVLFSDETPSICSNFLARCRPTEEVHSGFVNYLLSAIYSSRGTYPHIKQSTGIQNLDMSSYLDTRVSIPPLQVQEAIARFLDCAIGEILRATSRVELAIEMLADYRAALVTAAVTGQLAEVGTNKLSGSSS